MKAMFMYHSAGFKHDIRHSYVIEVGSKTLLRWMI